MTTYETEAAALAALAKCPALVESAEPGCYVTKGPHTLEHGEYARPSYFPRKYKDGWSIRRETYYYSGAHNAVPSWRVDLADLCGGPACGM